MLNHNDQNNDQYIVGGFLIEFVYTRPDLEFPVGILATQIQVSTNRHMTIEKSVLGYINGTPKHPIEYPSNPVTEKSLLGSVDAYSVGDIKHESTSPET